MFRLLMKLQRMQLLFYAYAFATNKAAIIAIAHTLSVSLTTII
jgi:hypothetical protein